MFFYVPQNIAKNMADEIEKFDNITDDIDNEIFKTAEKLAGEIQVDLQATTPELLSEHKTEFKPPKAAGKGKGGKVLKPQLIDSICELQEKLGEDNKRPRSHFERMTKVELEELLAHLTNKGINKLNGTNEQLKKKTHVSDDYDKENEAPDEARVNTTMKTKNIRIEQGAHQLYVFNNLIMGALEVMSTNPIFRDKIKTDLVGLTDDCIRNEKELKDILALVYEEHCSVLEEYFSSINFYLLTMGGIIGGRAVRNLQDYEKKKALEDL